MTSHSLYINGEWVPSTGTSWLEVIDPSTTETFARVPDASREDVDRAVAAARQAFDEGAWKDATAQDRGRILFKLAEIVRAARRRTRRAGSEKHR